MFWTEWVFKKDGVDLKGKEAHVAWAAQNCRCACGCLGDESHSISGSCGDKPAAWLGCHYCAGTALGQPIVKRG